jgi:hypothetical protein
MYTKQKPKLHTCKKTLDEKGFLRCECGFIEKPREVKRYWWNDPEK